MIVQQNPSSPNHSLAGGFEPCRETDVDDMNDLPQEMPTSEPLRTILDHWQQNLRSQFVTADRAALRSQKTYKDRARTAAILGSIAVALAILQLSSLVQGRWAELLPWVEGATAASTFLVVFLGMRSSFKERWLLERYQAESLRLLKFRSLIQSACWSANPAEIEKWKDRLCDQVEGITATTFSALQGWISRGTVPAVVEAPADGRVNESSLKELVRYYHKKRLHYQMSYFGSAARRNEANDHHTRLVGPALFFGSVAFVLAHLSVEIVGGSAHWLSRLLILSAAVLPAMGAGFRTHRAANEFARNAARFEAVRHTLSELSERLRYATDAPAIFRELGFGEQVLEADLREWMRLMMEAEWFG